MRAGIRNISRKTFLFPAVAAILLLLTFILPSLYEVYYAPKVITYRVQNEIIRAERDLNKLLNRVQNIETLNRGFILSEFLEKQNSLLHSKQITVLIYEKDSLIFWTDNFYPAVPRLSKINCSSCVEEAKNGYYLKIIRQKGNLTYVALQLIKNKYKYQNDYVSSNFADRFKVPNNTDFLLTATNFPVYNAAHQKLFSLGFSKMPGPGVAFTMIVFILFLSGIIYFNAAIFRYFFNFPGANKARWMVFPAFTLSTLILRIIIQLLKLPTFLFETDYFNPIFYADSEVLPSLGDFLITSILVLQIAYYFLKYFPSLPIDKLPSTLIKRTAGFLLNLIPALLMILLSDLIRSLIENSNISLTFNNILEFSHFSLIASIILGCLFLSYLFMFRTIARITRQLYDSRKSYLYDSIAIVVIYSIYILSDTRRFSSLLIPFSLGILYLIKYTEWNNQTPVKLMMKNLPVLLLTMAIMGAYQLHKSQYDKEIDKRQVLVGSLIDNHDQLAEYFFKNVKTEIQENINIRKKVDDLNGFAERQSALASSVVQKYFTGYWNKYNVQATLCSEKEQLKIKPGNYIIGCNDYFEKKIATNGKLTSTQDLYYISPGIDQTYYLGKILLSGLDAKEQKKVTIYIEISSPAAVKDIGYPELLLDKNQIKENNLAEYSYAIYRSGELIKNVGEFNYFINLNQYGLGSLDSTFFKTSGYNHIVSKVDSKTIVIISRKTEGFMGYIAPLAFFFLFFYLMFFFILLFSGDAIPLSLKNLSFAVRLQTGIVSVLLFSMLLVGGLSIFYLNRLNESKNEQIVKEKAHSVLLELEQNMASVNQLTPGLSDELSDELIKLSQIYFSDINIFTPEGYLLASSRRKIFEEGLQSENINPEALFQLNGQRKSFYIHDENIAKYLYLSAYVPLRNDDNYLLGYVNLPYFARQNELKAEISTLVSAFSNIYILLIAIAIFISIFIARYITHPLHIIREKLSQVQLGKMNMKIEWSGHDEISGLIEEYNKMVDELANRAEQLAQSERESAWRQMARQVAHEIKNPLTPMKLSMQLLMRAWEDKAPDWEERLKRFSQTLILQIDTLSAIASEFSDFAQMPATKLEKIDVVELLNISADIFKDYGHISILSNAVEKQFFIYADEKQILRVFNNLIKNSVQAISPWEKGEIIVTFEAQGPKCLITFSDNGVGIPKEKQGRIFTPDFTTKSGGMGLGLAMVKSIIDNTGGRISFESTEGQGTTFYITLPLYIED